MRKNISSSASNCTNDLTILIFSCAQFSDLWDNHVFLLKKYWANHPDFFLISDAKGNAKNNCDDYLLIYNQEQSNRLISAALQCDTDYIFLTLDDYFIKGRVNDDEIARIISFLKTNNLDYCRLYKKTKLKKPVIDKETGYRFLNFSNDVYEVNLYPGIWKKDSLLKVLASNESIWKTEVFMTNRFKANNLKGIAVYNHEKIFPFEDIVRKGKYLRKGINFLKKNNLYISNRQVRTIKEESYLLIRTLLSDYLPKCIKNKLKKIGNKCGKKYFSDYLELEGKENDKNEKI